MKVTKLQQESMFTVIYDIDGKREGRRTFAYTEQQAKANVMPYGSSLVDCQQITGQLPNFEF